MQPVVPIEKGESPLPVVLVVDDYEDSLYVMQLFIRSRGLDVITACNGLEACRIATLEHPSLILMDLSMPVMDGFEATRKLRSLPDTRSIPIMALSAHCDDPKMRRQALEAGCTDCFSKPVDIERLKSLLSSLLH